MHETICKISLTSERFGREPDGDEGLNTDVIVQFENGESYVGAFFSFKNLERLINDHRGSDGYFSSVYYKLLNGVLVNDFQEVNLRPVIEHMIIEGDFQMVFKKL